VMTVNDFFMLLMGSFLIWWAWLIAYIIYYD